MSDNHVVEFDYMAEEPDVVEFVDEFEGENYARDDGNIGMEEYDVLTKVTDTSAVSARQGKDIQGIPWDRLNITRDKYRLTRLEQYKNYENVPTSGETVDKEYKSREKGGNYFNFFLQFKNGEAYNSTFSAKEPCLGYFEA